MRCEGCGLESTREEIFQSAPKSFSRVICRLCPECFQTKDDAAYRFIFWSSAGLFVVGLILMILAPGTILGACVTNLALIAVFTFISTVLHELGHIFAARLVGFRGFGVEIGRGRIAFEFLLWGLRWQFRSIPAGGMAHIGLQDTWWYRARYSIVVLGGPLVDAGLMVIGFFARSAEQSLDSGLMKDVAPATMLCLSNAALLLFSLWPHSFQTGQGKSPNDALLLWQTWRRPKSYVEQIPSFFYYYESEEHRKRRDYSKAKISIEQGLARFPGNYYLEMSAGVNLLDLERYAEARRHFVLMLSRWSKHLEIRFILFNNIACATVLMENGEFLWQADACSRLALEAMPVVYVRGTRGSVLVELGRFEEAIPLLEEALKTNPDREGQAINACYLGMAYDRCGRRTESRSYFNLARKLDPTCFFLRRERKEALTIAAATPA